MSRITLQALRLVSMLLLTIAILRAIMPGQDRHEASVTVGNEFLDLTFKQSEGRLRPETLINHLTRQSFDLSSSEGFMLYLGAADPLSERISLTPSDFILKKWNRQEHSLSLELENRERQLGCVWHWASSPKEPFVRSWLEVKNMGNTIIEVADVDVLVLRNGGLPKTRPAPVLQTMVEADSETTTSDAQTSAWHAIDGNIKTSWVSRSAPSPHWLMLSFAKPVAIGHLVLTLDPLRTRQADHCELQIPGENGKWRFIASGEVTTPSSLTLRPAKATVTKRLRVLTKPSGLTTKEPVSVTVAELEIFDSKNNRVVFESESEIPHRRSVTYGNGEGVVQTMQGSAYAVLEALLYDYRMGVAADGSGFRLGHNPGWRIAPGEIKSSKKAVLGVAQAGEAGARFVKDYLTPNWIQTRQGDPQWDRYWAYNITADDKWSLNTDEMITLTRALAKTKEAYGFGFRHVGPDITAFVSYDPFRLGLNRTVFPDGFDRAAAAIEASGSSVEGYYGIGRVEDIETPQARDNYRHTFLDLLDRYRFKMVVFDAFVGGLGGYQVYLREQVWDNFRETVEAARAEYPGLMVGLESFSPNLLTRWLWANTQFDHHPTHYRRYNPDTELNNVRAELIPDAGAGAAPVLHGRDVVTASAGVYDLFGVPWRGAETFGPLWQLVYNPFYQGASAMERSRDNWVLNLFGAATAISPITYGRIFGQPPEDMAWLGRMLKLRNANLDILRQSIPKENGDIFHCKKDRGFAVFRNLQWRAKEPKSFRLDEGIGLSSRTSEFLVRQIYPTERVITKSTRDFSWHFGDTVQIHLNPFELRLVSIESLPALDELDEEVVVGSDYERDSENNTTLLGLPGESYQVKALTKKGPSRETTVAFEGMRNANPWYRRLVGLSPISDQERSSKTSEFCKLIDFVKATAFPAEWRHSNLYGLPEFHRKHPYPFPEIEAAREIKMEPVYASQRWFCDGDLGTPPPIVPVGIVHAPLVVGTGVLQLDLGRIVNVQRIRVAVKERPTRIAVSLSHDALSWNVTQLNPDGRFWDSGPTNLRGRYMRVDSADLTIQEFQIFENSSNDGQPLDYSRISPYPVSFVRSLTKPEDITQVWGTKVNLPSQIYDGQEIAFPVWLKEESLLSDLWLLYRVNGENRSRYRIVPGYAKEGDRTWNLAKVKGLTFKIPITPSDSGKELRASLVSAKPIDRAEAWLVSDPLPFVRKPWSP